MSTFPKPVLAVLVLGVLSARAGAVEVKPYGFILANYVQSWGRPNATDVPSQAVSNGNALPPNQNVSMFTARQSRLGLSLSGGKGPWDSGLSGTLEADFYGLRNTSSASLDSQASAPRLRLAYLQAKSGGTTIMFGQDWVKAFAPLNPSSLSHQAVPALSSSGNLWNRVPQLRWDQSWTDGEWALETRAALSRAFSADESGRTATVSVSTPAVASAGGASSGDFAAGPELQALVEIRRKVEGRTFSAGVSAQYLRQSFNPAAPAPAGVRTRKTDGLLWAAHFVAPVLAPLELSGEAFYGRSDAGLNGLGAAYNDLGHARTSQTRGGWAQATVKPRASWRVNAMAGFESLDRTGLAAAAIHRNETVAVNAIWDASAELALSVEFGRIHSYFVRAPAGDTENLGLAAQYKF
jgi:hypothetical protein